MNYIFLVGDWADEFLMLYERARVIFDKEHRSHFIVSEIDALIFDRFLFLK